MTLSRRYKLRPRWLRNYFASPTPAVELNDKITTGQYPLETVACPVCGRHDLASVSEIDRHHVQSAVKICRACGLVQTNPRPTMEAYAKYYAAEYSGLEYGHDTPNDALFQSQRARGIDIVDYLRRNNRMPPAGARVLEVGCNTGGILDVFREHGYEIKGVDLNARFTEYGRETHGLDVGFGTIDDVSPTWRPRLIIYSHTFEHVTRPNDELQKVKGRLADGGQLYVQVPGIKSLHEGYAMDFRAYIQFAHTYHFSLTSLTNLLRANGFRLVCGDETVNAVFEVSDERATYESDYRPVMAYLTSAERRRRLLRAQRIVGHAYRVARSRLRR